MTINLEQFIARNRVRMSAEWADSNPNMADMPGGSSHWKCKIKAGKRSMTVYFSQGPAHSREPTAADLLDCLASDASTIDNARGFEEFCSELGYDTDSRKAERIFKVC